MREAFLRSARNADWPPVTRAQFDALLGPTGALLVGDPETVAEKILRIHESLGGIARLTFQMSVATYRTPNSCARLSCLGRVLLLSCEPRSRLGRPPFLDEIERAA